MYTILQNSDCVWICPTSFFDDTNIVEVRNIYDALSDSRPVRIDLHTANIDSTVPSLTVASGCNNGDSRTKTTVN